MVVFSSSLETDVSIEREWRTTLQAEKESFVKEIDALKLALTQVPKLQKVSHRKAIELAAESISSFYVVLWLQEVESLKEERKNLQETISEYEVTLDDMGSKIRLLVFSLFVDKNHIFWVVFCCFI